jgi:cytochrome c biogenesis protein
MLPLELDGRWYLMSGVRESPNESFRYLRMPLDAEGNIDGFMRLRGALMNVELHPEIAARFARQALPQNAWGTEIEDKLKFSAIQCWPVCRWRLPVAGAFIEEKVPAPSAKSAAPIAHPRARCIRGAADRQPARQAARPKADDATGWLVRDTSTA